MGELEDKVKEKLLSLLDNDEEILNILSDYVVTYLSKRLEGDGKKFIEDIISHEMLQSDKNYHDLNQKISYLTTSLNSVMSDLSRLYWI